MIDGRIELMDISLQAPHRSFPILQRPFYPVHTEMNTPSLDAGVGVIYEVLRQMLAYNLHNGMMQYPVRKVGQLGNLSNLSAVYTKLHMLVF